MLDARSSRELTDPDQYLVVANVKERFSVSKRSAQKFNVERLNRRKVIELKAMKQYQVKIPDRFTALELFRDRENIIETVKISAKENLGL
jgi:hypothetical protein